VYQNEEKRFRHLLSFGPWDGMLDIPSEYVDLLSLWDIYYDGQDPVRFFQNGLIFNQSVFIDKIIKAPNGYIVTVLGDEGYDPEYAQHTYIPSWPHDGNEKFFDLIMEFDGDYLEVYVNDKDTLFGRLLFRRVYIPA
jgi:hypothetical protein